MIQNQQLRGKLSATNSTSRPGAFAVGSPQSRAAARRLLETKVASAKRLDWVLSVVGKPDIYNPPIVGKWEECPDGTLTRFSRIPWGMTIEEAERMAL